MLCLVPHLFPPARMRGAVDDLRLPALETLLARGRIRDCPADGVEAALCQALGIARQQDWPLAPITLEADGGHAGDAYWMRADPVHLALMRDRIVLAGPIALPHEESDALAATIIHHFGAELDLHPLHPQRWYLRFAAAPALATVPLSAAIGRDIEPLQPQGGDARTFRARLNELQMLLHAHPVNEAREARGQPPVNSLWLWGGGHRPTAPASPPSVYAAGAEAHALAAFCGVSVAAPPAHPDRRLLRSDAVAVLDTVAGAASVGDPWGWRSAMRELERDWFVPLRAALRGAASHGLQLMDPLGGRSVHLTAGDAWRLWRRPRPLTERMA
ncbi:MAG TPA: hypothetical protein PKC12_06295 [Thiobacillaceae bacterium]|nr:hypothetical protein [Thiobacillaceae bacterium]